MRNNLNCVRVRTQFERGDCLRMRIQFEKGNYLRTAETIVERLFQQVKSRFFVYGIIRVKRY
jgi:hypothetical protein